MGGARRADPALGPALREFFAGVRVRHLSRPGFGGCEAASRLNESRLSRRSRVTFPNAGPHERHADRAESDTVSFVA
jgi:hypothetical protein